MPLFEMFMKFCFFFFKDLEELAKNEIGSNRFYAISMGQGQQQNAIDTLRRAAENGDWVCLKNLHLVIASLPAIQKVSFACMLRI